MWTTFLHWKRAELNLLAQRVTTNYRVILSAFEVLEAVDVVLLTEDEVQQWELLIRPDHIGRLIVGQTRRQLGKVMAQSRQQARHSIIVQQLRSQLDIFKVITGRAYRISVHR